MTFLLPRRTALLAGAGLLATPSVLRAQENPIRLGSLTPNSGSGGAFGPEIAEAHRKVVELANSKGGLLGRRIVLTQEDDESNPKAGVRAARKLIDADRATALLGPKAGKTLSYDGASSSADFKPDGSLAARDFELYEIRGVATWRSSA